MKKILCLLVVLAGAFELRAADDASEIKAVLFAQQAAWNRGDLVAYMDGYWKSDALIFTSGGRIRRGWQDADDHYKAKYGGVVLDGKPRGTTPVRLFAVRRSRGACLAAGRGHGHGNGR